MHALITFLGKGRNDLQTGYRETTYQFDQFENSKETTPYFGLALAKQTQTDQIILLGTASSMWDVFLEEQLTENKQEELRLELMDRVQSASVDQDLLDRVAPLLNKATGLLIQPVLIGMAQSDEEQRAILDRLADQVTRFPIRTISMDLTHGFRHLGMLGFLSAFVLERLYPRKIQLVGLWYGAHDMARGGVSPALRLDGLQATQRWVDALNQFEASGNYAVFAELLMHDGVPEDKAQCLVRAAFHENTLDIAAAQQQLRTFLSALTQPLPGASGLFQHQLESHLNWARSSKLSTCQHELALRALQRHDYRTAAMLAWEGYLSLLCEQAGADPRHYEAREGEKEKALNEALNNRPKDRPRKDQTLLNLNSLRNALVHGTASESKRNRVLLNDKQHTPHSVLRNPELLEKALRDCIQSLF